MIASLDAATGRLLEQLDELGLTNDTLVIFTSDNGGVGGFAAEGLDGQEEITSNAPLRGGKGMLYEGGIRVPFFASWPGRIGPDTTCTEPVTLIDLVPTFLELSGGPAWDGSDAHVLDGVSLAPLLGKDAGAGLERDAIFWFTPVYVQGKQRDTWRATPVNAVRSGDLKLLEFFEDDRLELYDLKSDPGETTNLVDSRPAEAAALHHRLRSWRRDLKARRPLPAQRLEQR